MRRILVGLILFAFMAIHPVMTQAQLVSDGGTNILDAISTTVTGNVSVGTNGPFTFLLLTNAATVTNTGIAYVGQNGAAKSNAVVVTGAGSLWEAQGGFYVGYLGDANALNILDGGVVTNQFAYIGAFANSNSVVVSDTNSFWNMQWTRTGLYGSLRVGSSGAGNTLVITNGAKVADGFAYIGENIAGAGNSVLVTGAGSTWSHLTSYQIGYNGSGNRLVITNGGRVTGGAASIGFQGTNNTVLVTGTNSLWANNNVTINTAFNQVLVRDGGTLSNTTFCTIGQYGNSNTVCVADPGSLWTNSAYLLVGWAGHGNQLVVSNGGTVAVDYTQVDSNNGSQEKVTITGAGSLLTNRNDFFLGATGSSNQLLVADGGKLANNIGYIGYTGFNASSNQAVITDANSYWQNRSDLYVGYNNARSLLVISNGAKVSDTYGYVGNGAGSASNLVVVTGAGSKWWHNALYLGVSGAANQLIVSTAGLVSAENAYVGVNSTSTSNLLTVDGGNLIITNFNNGILNVQRGTVALNSGLIQVDWLGLNSGPAARFNFAGGTLRTLNMAVNNGAACTIGDGTNAASYVLANNQSTTGTHSFNNGLVVSSNAILTGVGTVNGNVFIKDGGTISPGTTNLLLLTLNGALVLSNASYTAIQLNAQSGQCTHFAGNTDVTLGGTLQLTNVAGTLVSGMSFRLFQTTNCHGAFRAITPPTPGFGRKWNTHQLNVDGTLRVFNVDPAPPVIASVARAANELVIQATGGIPYDPCCVLTSTNLIDWQSATTNMFDAAGNAACTNAIAPDEPARFFRLQVE